MPGLRKVLGALVLLVVSTTTPVSSLTRVVDEWRADQPSSVNEHATAGRRLFQLRSRKCLASCSYQLMLPCSFPSLDHCLEDSCKEICKKSNQIMNSCFCQSVKRLPEGRRTQVQTVTYRACYCQPSQKEIKQQIAAAKANPTNR